MAEEGGPDYLILRHGRAVGVVSAVADEEGAVRQALEDDGFSVEGPARQEGEAQVFDLEETCTEEKPRPCELTVALGLAKILAEQGGVTAEEIDAIEARGTVTEEEAEQVIRSVVGRLPEDMHPQGEALLDEAFHGGGKGGDAA